MMTYIEHAVSILKQGGIILYPTDTIWGIGCDATNNQAVERIYQIKKRTDQRSMLVLVDRIDMIYRYVESVPSMALELLKITDHPLTIIYPNAQNLAPNLVAADGSIGIRICKAPLCQRLIRIFGKPIVSTSANTSGLPAPLSDSEIEPYIREAVDHIIEDKDRRGRFNKPSSIIKLGMDNQIQIIRP